MQPTARKRFTALALGAAVLAASLLGFSLARVASAGARVQVIGIALMLAQGLATVLSLRRAVLVKEERKVWLCVGLGTAPLAFGAFLIATRGLQSLVTSGGATGPFLVAQTVAFLGQGLALAFFPHRQEPSARDLKEASKQVLAALLPPLTVITILGFLGPGFRFDSYSCQMEWANAARIGLAGSFAAYRLAQRPSRMHGPLGWIMGFVLCMFIGGILIHLHSRELDVANVNPVMAFLLVPHLLLAVAGLDPGPLEPPAGRHAGTSFGTALVLTPFLISSALFLLVEVHGQGLNLWPILAFYLQILMLVGLILLYLRDDITIRKRAEHSSRGHQARMEAIFNSTEDFIWSVDAADFALLTFNRSLAEYFAEHRNLRLREGMPQAELFPAGPHAEFWDRAYRRALREGTYTEQYQTSALTRLLRLTFHLLERDGKVFGISVFGRDITERVQHERDRLAMAAQIQHLQRVESLGRLAGGVAHDMNNVLATIMSVASLIQIKGGEAAPQADLLMKACFRGRDLVRSLLDFARKDVKNAALLDLNELVHREAALLASTNLQKFQIQEDLQPGLPAFHGDESALSNALMNLCVNAMDAMPEGGTLTLRTLTVPGDKVQLVVEDTGEGMSEEVLSRALEPFFTTKPAGKGTGLGLSMIFGTARAHDGSLDLQSKVGQGTRVVLTLSTKLASSLPATREPKRLERAPVKPRRILLVDDDPLIRASLPPLLEALGHAVQVADNGVEALRCLEETLPPELLVLDLNMPNLDGEATLWRVRRLRPRMPVLIASGYIDELTRERLVQLPLVTLLAKPFGVEDLQIELDRLG